MSVIWIRESLGLWADQIRRAGSQQSSMERIFYTGLIGAQSYRDGFEAFRPIEIPAVAPQPNNPYGDPNAKQAWSDRLRRRREGAAQRASEVAAFRPQRQWRTDLKGCLLKATDLGARRIFLATDLVPAGGSQPAELHFHGVSVTVLFFCHTNDARACSKLAGTWVDRFTAAGAHVRLLDPAQAGNVGDLFATG